MPSYAYSGAPQFVTVDATGEYEITAFGAQGGSAGAYAGGNGAEVQGEFNLTAGEHLEIIVGGEGTTGDNTTANPFGAGGGGGTFILANTGPGGTYQLLEVAGGGGGGGPLHAGYGGTALGSAGNGDGGAGQFFGAGGGAGVNSQGGTSAYGANGGHNGHYTPAPYSGGATGGYSGPAGGFGGGGAGSPFDSGGSGGGGGYSGGAATGGTAGGAGGGTSWVSAGALGSSSVGSENTGDGQVQLTPAVCFCSGTLIRTARGEVAVEDLQVGDLAVTATGQARPIVWIGFKRVERPNREQWPVRVMASTFGENLPARDLWLSPGHAVCLNLIEEVFVPVGELVNGATVAQMDVDEVTYWHVELESHDVLLAEDLRCESYMDAGNRAFFGREYGRLEEIDPERGEASLAAYARTFVNDASSLEAIRRRLAARAERLGWTRTSDQDLHLMVDGRRLEPVIEAGVACFAFLAGARTAWLCSRTFSPSWTGEGQDRRELGVCLRNLRLGDGKGPGREIPLGEIEGVHPEEAESGHAWRWTDGALELPKRIWSACDGLVILTVATQSEAVWGWKAPESISPENMVSLAKRA